MIAVYVEDDDMVDYTPTADVAPGDVIIQGDLVGIAVRDIKANLLGALLVEGIFDMPKAVGPGSGIAAGTKVYWDLSNLVVTATAGTNKYVGKTISVSNDNDTTARVRLCP